jgi:KipI family sensor histidine kinase inhibitor
MITIRPAGDRAVLVTLGTRMEPSTLARMLALDRALQSNCPAGLLTTVPAYASLLCIFDPDVTTSKQLAEAVEEIDIGDATLAQGRRHEIPVRYGGLDLERVASRARLTAEAVIELHAQSEYLVYCLGFAPGFIYCGEVPEAIATPRLDSPRTKVPTGSIGIAGRQTGVYAVESPGGWNLIGTTSMTLFDPADPKPSPFSPGDSIRFVPVR